VLKRLRGTPTTIVVRAAGKLGAVVSALHAGGAEPPGPARAGQNLRRLARARVGRGALAVHTVLVTHWCARGAVTRVPEWWVGWSIHFAQKAAEFATREQRIQTDGSQQIGCVFKRMVRNKLAAYSNG
jgi:hypothetical protein